jgi:hypothetical protein
MERNSLVTIAELEIGDRFHIAGKKEKRGVVQEFTYLNEHEEKCGNKYRVIVKMDGEQFTTTFKPEKEVVYLRSL